MVNWGRRGPHDQTAPRQFRNPETTMNGDGLKGKVPRRRRAGYTQQLSPNPRPCARGDGNSSCGSSPPAGFNPRPCAKGDCLIDNILRHLAKNQRSREPTTQLLAHRIARNTSTIAIRTESLLTIRRRGVDWNFQFRVSQSALSQSPCRLRLPAAASATLSIEHAHTDKPV